MSICYEDLLSGDYIFIENIGHFRSPFLYELKPSNLGYEKYNEYLNLLCLKVKEDSTIDIFSALCFNKELRGRLAKALSFFIQENLTFDNVNNCFILTDKNGLKIGEINKDNYEIVRETIFELNYMKIPKQPDDKKMSKKAKKLLMKAEKFRAKYREAHKDDQVNKLGNIISKLCSVHNSYNLLNVYNLTIYQLYDQFSEICHLRSFELSERIYSIHGGDKFNGSEWLKEIYKKEK